MISATSIAHVTPVRPSTQAVMPARPPDMTAANDNGTATPPRKRFSEADLQAIFNETFAVLVALNAFRKEGVADPLAAARHAVARTRAMQILTGTMAMSGALEFNPPQDRVEAASDARFKSASAGPGQAVLAPDSPGQVLAATGTLFERDESLRTGQIDQRL